MPLPNNSTAFDNSSTHTAQFAATTSQNISEQSSNIRSGIQDRLQIQKAQHKEIDGSSESFLSKSKDPT